MKQILVGQLQKNTIFFLFKGQIYFVYFVCWSFIIYNHILFYLYVWLFFLYVCLGTTWMPGAFESQKKVLDSLNYKWLWVFSFLVIWRQDGSPATILESVTEVVPGLQGSYSCLVCPNCHSLIETYRLSMCQQGCLQSMKDKGLQTVGQSDFEWTVHDHLPSETDYASLCTWTNKERNK